MNKTNKNIIKDNNITEDMKQNSTEVETEEFDYY